MTRSLRGGATRPAATSRWRRCWRLAGLLGLLAVATAVAQEPVASGQEAPTAAGQEMPPPAGQEIPPPSGQEAPPPAGQNQVLVVFGANHAAGCSVELVLPQKNWMAPGMTP